MASTMRSMSLSQARSVSLRPPQKVRTLKCSAASKQISTALGTALLAGVVSLGSADVARADIAGLTPCSESKGFAKLLKKEIKTLEKRLSKYEAGSAPSVALQATIERTEKRFANYSKAGLLCGADGLPHLIADPGLALKYGHAGEIFIPTFGFLYVAGWIGSVGREYLKIVKSGKDATQKEIIIDVPLALKLSIQGFVWPLRTIQELRAGSLTEVESQITVSPR